MLGAASGAARTGVRPMLALSVGGMGSGEKNFYNRLVSSYGFEREAEQVRELYLAGRKSEAMLALPDDLIDAVSIAGSPQRAKERLRAFADAGVDTLLVSPMAFDSAERKEQLRLVADLGRLAGTQQAIDWGFQANAHPPVLRTHDRFGNRIDEVEFHPTWHRLTEVAVGHGLHALPWREPRPGAHAARAAAFYVWSQVEGGHGCPVSMTYAAIPALRTQPNVAERWEPLMTTLDYDPGLRPPAGKRGVLLGLAMTEKHR